MTEPQDLTVLQALHSTPARRHLPTEPIPDEVLWELLDAAVRGPSGGNTQTWAWIVVRDPAVKERIAGWYREGWDRLYGARREEIMNAPDNTKGMSKRSFL